MMTARRPQGKRPVQKMKASDILICTDFDGTLSYDGIPEANIRAIREFMEDGGLFTFATGRDGKNVLKTELPFLPNAPMVGLTGSELYDLQRKSRIRGYYMDDGWQDILRDLAEGVPVHQRFEIVYEDGFVPGEADGLEKLIAAVGSKRVMKIVAFTDYGGAEPFPPEAVKICRGRCSVTSNGYTTYEMTPLGVDKGTGVLELKKLTGAKLLVCAGDYVGDIPMLTAADLSYAVDNAAEAVKSAADRVTLHAGDGAIAAIIHELTNVQD